MKKQHRLVIVPISAVSILIAIGMACAFYFLVVLLFIRNLSGVRDSWLSRVLADDVHINLGTYIAFSIAMVVLIKRNHAVNRQFETLDGDLLSNDDQTLMLPDDALALRRKLNAMDRSHQERIPIQLLSAGLQRARVVWSTTDVAEAIKTRAETIQGQIDSEYSIVRYLAWAIPSIGFIGTVYGLGAAIGSMRVIPGQETSDEQRMQGAIGFLFTAFDTTLVALILSIVLMFCFYRFQAKEDSLVVNSLDWCMRRFVLRMHTAKEADR